MKCKVCEEDMQSVESPRVIISISIPFTKLSFELWDWGHKELQCINCANESQREKYEGLSEGISEVAYREGYRDGQAEQDRY
jgi:hypothetical protein